MTAISTITKVMEADSTTIDSRIKEGTCLNLRPTWPFTVLPRDLDFYIINIQSKCEEGHEEKLVDWLQDFGLIPAEMQCPTAKPDCCMVRRATRVIDRTHWFCTECKCKLSVRTNSFFFKLQCPISSVLQIVLGWCEDVDYMSIAQYLDVKPRVVWAVYERLDEFAATEQRQVRLGGPGTVVLAEMFPECVHQLAPDTTNQTHTHHILMLADTKHIPTKYSLHVITGSLKRKSEYVKKIPNKSELVLEVGDVISRLVLPHSAIISGLHTPPIDGATPVQSFNKHCDASMMTFLGERIWRQALVLCTAAQEPCLTRGRKTCADSAQRYLDAALYRLSHPEGFYPFVLQALAQRYNELQ